MELLVPTVSDVIFKYTWSIPRYKKSISKKTFIDSSSFNTNVNGIQCSWNLSIRFWKDPDGKRDTYYLRVIILLAYTKGTAGTN